MQAEGLPIGGPHSPACCSVVLCADETRWAAGADRRAALGNGDADDVLEAKAAYARYVDDLCVISKVWREPCLETMASAMYVPQAGAVRPPGVVEDRATLAGHVDLVRRR